MEARMKITHLMLVMVAGSLAACGSHWRREGGPQVRVAPDKCKVGVHVIGPDNAREVVVDHEPVHRKGCGGSTITFTAQGSWKFDGVGIRFRNPPTTFRMCDAPSSGGNKVDCHFNKGPIPDGKPYKYDVLLRNNQGETASADPTVIND
jgi:hypothetical protein